MARHKRRLVTDPGVLRFDVADLRRAGLLPEPDADPDAEPSPRRSWPGGRGLPAVELRFTATRPHFGGRVWWILCPECGRRVGLLYLPQGATAWACRRCHQLTYRSAQEADRRAYALRWRLIRGQVTPAELAELQATPGGAALVAKARRLVAEW